MSATPLGLSGSPLILFGLITTAIISAAISVASAEPPANSGVNKDTYGEILNLLEKAPVNGPLTPPIGDTGSGMDLGAILEKSGAPKPKNPEDLAKLFGAMVGVPSSSRFFPRIRENVLRGVQESKTEEEHGAGINNEELRDEELAAPEIFNVVAHFRGKEGISLPTEADMPQVPEPSEAELKQVVANYKNLLGATVPQMQTPREIARCTKGRTEKEISDYSGDSANKIIFDMLIIGPEDLPKDPDEAFGKEVSIRIYDPKGSPTQALSLLTMGIDCLPYRIRATQQTKFRHFGEDALKNFDRNATGSGEVAPALKAQLKRQK